MCDVALIYPQNVCFLLDAFRFAPKMLIDDMLAIAQRAIDSSKVPQCITYGTYNQFVWSKLYDSSIFPSNFCDITSHSLYVTV